MRYVHVTAGVKEVVILVSDLAKGAEIKAAAVRQMQLSPDVFWGLQGCNANGTNSIIGDLDTPRQSDFTLTDNGDKS